MNSEIEKLRAVVADEQQPLLARKDAAEHLVRLQVETVEAAGVPDDDPEVVELQKPWSDPSLAKLFAKAPGLPPLAGWPLPDAKVKVLKRRNLRAVLSVVVDGSLHRLERLAACEAILKDFMHSQGFYNRNNYTAERLLAKAKSGDALKWDSPSWKRGPIPVVRPPHELADVWDS